MSSYQHTPSHQHRSVYLDIPERTESGFTTPHVCDLRYGLPGPGAAAVGYGGVSMPYIFDPSVPSPQFGCPPLGFPLPLPPPPVHPYSNRGGAPPYHSLPPPGRPALHTPHDSQPSPAEDEALLQRNKDKQWLQRFLQSRAQDQDLLRDRCQQGDALSLHTRGNSEQLGAVSPIPDLRQALFRAAQFFTQLDQACQTLGDNMETVSVWSDSYSKTLHVKRELQDILAVVCDMSCLDAWKLKVSHVSKRRAHRQRTRRLQRMDKQQREEHVAEKDAAIDAWRMQQIRQVEEKKKEQELKVAADAVLCEVRKKQADVKRMQDVLKSLEKLRRLRKEAASRKGIATEQECEEVFNSQLEQLRSVLKKRTAVYSVEEMALMVMLEGEQEEERRREMEKRANKKWERQLQRKHRIDSILFGKGLPVDSVLQPYTDFYIQAEHSLHALLQIRRGWDVFVVAVDHPEGSAVPQSWVLPDSPSDSAWASYLLSADTD